MSYEDSLKAGHAAALLSWRFAEIKCIPDVVRYWAVNRPTKTALVEGAATRTYAQLDEASNRLANRLIQRGIARGSNIGFVGKNSIETFEVWFGATKAGCALAALNWRCSVEELIAILDDSQSPMVFVGAEFLETMRSVQARCRRRFEIVSFGPGSEPNGGLADWLKDASTSDPKLPLVGTDVALLSYTSGTTGQSKGVMASQEAFAFSFLCGALEPAMAWRDDDIMLMSMPNFHLAGSWVSMAALYQGAALSILPAFDPAAFLGALRRDRPTIAPLVPAAIQLLLNWPNVGPHDFESLRTVMYFGSPISPATARRAIEVFGCQFHQFYGATEAWFVTILRHDQHLGENPHRLASCGLPLPLVSVRIADNTGAEVAPGVVGEVLVRTPMSFVGYCATAGTTPATWRGATRTGSYTSSIAPRT